MNMKLKPKKEQLHIAKETTSLDVLKDLHTSQYMNVRRAVARNKHISSEIADILLFDPVLNVSYMASKSSKCTIKRNFQDLKLAHCVLCDVDERYLECIKCENRNKSLLNNSI